MGRTNPYTLRRRRLMGLGLLTVFLAGSLGLNGWTPTPIWALFDTDEGAFIAGDPYGDWIYAECDGERQAVTVSRNGRLAGAAALESLRTVRFPDWCGLPTVDNPELAAWQAQLDRLQSLIAAPGADGSKVLDVAREMPVSYLYLRPLSEWIRADDANAVAFLDALAVRPMRFDHRDGNVVAARTQAFGGLIDTALDMAAAKEVTPERFARWLATTQIAGSGGRLEKLARIGQDAEGTAAMMLEQIDAAAMPRRGELYAMLAERLAHDGRHAALLARQLRTLPPPARSVAARRLLARPDVGVDLPMALLANFRHTFGHVGADAQLDAFMAIAGKLSDERDAPLLLTRHVKHIPGVQRRMAANYLLTLDDAGESAFALAVLRAFADFHPISRPKLAYAVMQSAQFQEPAVQEAFLLAVRLEVRGQERQELLDAMLRHEGLAGDLRARIRAERG